MPFPTRPGTYPGKDQVAGYLTAYADRFDLPVMLNTQVRRVDRSPEDDSDGGGLFRVSTSQGDLWARQVVVATGPFQQPDIPRVGSGFAPAVSQLHSSTTATPALLPAESNGKVLVVGAGNSGLQIALELSRTHRGPPRRRHPAEGRAAAPAGPRPVLVAHQDRARHPARRPPLSLRGSAGAAVTWSSARPGTTSTPRASTSTPGSRTPTGAPPGSASAPTTLSTRSQRWCGPPGSGPTTPGWTSPACGTAGGSARTRGRTDVPGLWFIGLPWQHTRGSALLGFVGDDAARVTSQVAAGHAAAK